MWVAATCCTAGSPTIEYSEREGEMDNDTDNAVATWTAPNCPFTIEYSLRVLDDIRLAVVDAFFSLPRGGAEIGGILLGEHSKRRLAITDYVALDCEHVYGPSFALSRETKPHLRSCSKPRSRIPRGHDQWAGITRTRVAKFSFPKPT